MASLRRTMSRDALWRPLGSYAPYACQLAGIAFALPNLEFIGPEDRRLLQSRPARMARPRAKRALDRLPPKANTTDFVLTPQHTSTGLTGGLLGRRTWFFGKPLGN